MKFPENCSPVADLQPDYLGFIFYESSERFVGPAFDATSLDLNSSAVEKVGVFVNASNREIVNLAKSNQISSIQLHGKESPQQCRDLRSLGFTVIKAFLIAADFDFKELNEYEDAVDYFLFDSQSENYGGSGKTFRWQELEKYELALPFFLSGGLGTHNLNELLAFEHPRLYGFDFNSKLEVSPGLKDVNTVKLTIEKIRYHEWI